MPLKVKGNEHCEQVVMPAKVIGMSAWGLQSEREASSLDIMLRRCFARSIKHTNGAAQVGHSNGAAGR